VHEIKLDGYRMAARIDNGRVQLLTRTGLNWTAKYPTAVAALASLNVKTAYLDGELCGVDDAGLPSFAQTQAATDGERGVHLVYYAFDLLHLGGWDVSGLSLVERKALLEPLVVGKPGLQYNGHDAGDGELILKHAGKLGFEGVVSKTIDAPYLPGNRGLWRKAKALNRQEFVVVGWSDPEGSLRSTENSAPDLLLERRPCTVGQCLSHPGALGLECLTDELGHCSTLVTQVHRIRLRGWRRNPR
jgi:ATP-dependent DNA ligase